VCFHNLFTHWFPLNGAHSRCQYFNTHWHIYICVCISDNNHNNVATSSATVSISINIIKSKSPKSTVSQDWSEYSLTLQRNLTSQRRKCSEQLRAERVEIYDNNNFRGQRMKWAVMWDALKDLLFDIRLGRKDSAQGCVCLCECAWMYGEFENTEYSREVWGSELFHVRPQVR